jgi:hypothetical protein
MHVGYAVPTASAATVSSFRNGPAPAEASQEQSCNHNHLHAKAVSAGWAPPGAVQPWLAGPVRSDAGYCWECMPVELRWQADEMYPNGLTRLTVAE